MIDSKLSPVRLGLSLGIIWGLSLFAMGLLAYYYTYGHEFVRALATLYWGYSPSIQGSVLGGAIGFVDAFITGFLIAWVYNILNCGQGSCYKNNTNNKKTVKTKDLKNDK